MNTSTNNSWEDHWRKKIDEHTPLPATEDWQGMTRLLDRKTPARAENIIEQEPTGPMPWAIRKRALPRLSWPVWIGLLSLVIVLGLWLGATQGEMIHQEMKAIIETNDTFPPHYALNRYWTYDRQGNRIGEMHSDTVWLDYPVRKRGVHVLLSPGKVSDYRIDTVLHISGKGALLSVRYDTVTPPIRKPGELVIWGVGHRSIHDDCTQDVL